MQSKKQSKKQPGKQPGMPMKVRHLVIGGLIMAAPVAARAHITIDNPTAVAGGYTKVVLRITHGCDGSATRSVAVHVPEGFRFAKAQVKPGWTATYEKAKLAKPIQSHGRSLTETTAVIRWEGGHIPHDQFDEFALHGQVSQAASGPMSFRVLQSCDEGQTDWSGAAGSRTPAPVLMIRRGAPPATPSSQ